VDNLFYNVPARRKFLKSNATELNNILAAYERIVLVYPDVAFSLHSNGAELLALRPCGLRQRIIDVFGKRLNQELLPVAVDTTLCRISGFVGKPEAAKKKGAHQFFFVNGRYMRHPYFAKAVMAPFERLLPQGEQVPFFIYFDIDPSDIDVNIHPTKTEIKFNNEQAIWQILAAAVKEAVGKFNDVPSIDFDTEGKPDIPLFVQGGATSTPSQGVNPRYNPFKDNRGSREASNAGKWEELFPPVGDAETQERSLFDDPGEERTATEDIIEEKSPAHYQYKGRWVMTAVKSGLMVIDQHRAHLRVLYEEYLDKMVHHRWASQSMLFPDIVAYPPAEAEVVRQIIPELREVGFSISDLGGGSFSIDGVPADIEGVDPTTMFREIVAAAKDKTGRPKEEVDAAVALTLARGAAIPQGQVLSNEEMESLVNRLFSCSNVNMTPDGKTILAILRQEEMERLLA
jgi:DNA mismatch repair protein MutL